MLREAPANELNTMLLAHSLSSAFLARSKCDGFAVSPGIKFSQMELTPHFIMPYELARADRSLGQTFNAVSRFISAKAVPYARICNSHVSAAWRLTRICASQEYQELEKKYLSSDFTCGAPTADSSEITLYSQLGEALQPS
jgi:hypothetical protein